MFYVRFDLRKTFKDSLQSVYKSSENHEVPCSIPGSHQPTDWENYNMCGKFWELMVGVALYLSKSSSLALTDANNKPPRPTFLLTALFIV